MNPNLPIPEPKKKGHAIMVQGTSSHAGKSTLVAALCRILLQEGLSVAPFKSQNMSLNSAVTVDGLEIGRAQMLQAQAAGIVATAHMNPVLLKPQGERASQIVIRGKAVDVQDVRTYYSQPVREKLWPLITESLDSLLEQYDVVVIEGAGSPAEINLQERDLANMRVAMYANADVILVGDIERGGVFASLYGTVELVSPEERALIKAFIINKFRGDVTLVYPGPEMLQERTGIPTLGVLPYFTNIHLPEEDSLATENQLDSGVNSKVYLDVVIPRIPHMSNTDDFDRLRDDPRLRVRIVSKPSEYGAPDLIVLPGSKTTIKDLLWLNESGLSDLIVQSLSEGAAVIGICGGFQMLGSVIKDENNVESDLKSLAGLGLLDVETSFEANKSTNQVQARIVNGFGMLEGCAGMLVDGYEIHMGKTVAVKNQMIAGSLNESASDGMSEVNCYNAFMICGVTGDAVGISDVGYSEGSHESLDGILAGDGWVLGTYIHGIFQNDDFRERLILNIAQHRGITLAPVESVRYSLDNELNKLASHVRKHIDVGEILRWVNVG